MTEPALPDTVHITATESSITGNRVVHIDDDCPQLGRRVRDVPLAAFPPAHRRRCQVCATPGPGYDGGNQPSTKLSTKLAHADPDDVGGSA